MREVLTGHLWLRACLAIVVVGDDVLLRSGLLKTLRSRKALFCASLIARPGRFGRRKARNELTAVPIHRANNRAGSSRRHDAMWCRPYGGAAPIKEALDTVVNFCSITTRNRDRTCS